MAKENVKRFFDLISGSEELQKEFQKRDAEYAKTHELPSDDASDEVKAEARLAAAKDIVIPMAGEHGLEFTIDELIEYEKEMLDDEEGELDRSDLRSIAGGEYEGIYACFFVGGGHVDNPSGWCYVGGLTFGICIWRGIQM